MATITACSTIITKMATITDSSTTSSIARVTLFHNGSRPSSVLGLPTMSKLGKVKCSIEGKPEGKESGSTLGIGASLVAATCVATMSNTTTMALVDERLSTEGTGLPFGLSNNLLGWILLGVFGLIWSLYFVYTSGLDEDDDSGLSL